MALVNGSPVGAKFRMRYLWAALAGVATALLMAIPTAVLQTPWFGREVPVRWWEYPTLAAVGVLTALWFAIDTPRSGGGTAAVGGVTLATFAVGCPVCNKLVLMAVGTTGALGLWAPVQPFLAVVSVILLAGLVGWRWRRRPCGDGACN
ncbi:hypothetical protein [Mycolicibacterium sp.]|uniref:hypothetical protein n=1 Tax=Mycolicibacterium sp. TaxID=2320850 RepID=UPI00355E34FA